MHTAALSPSPNVKRFWLVGGAIALFLVTLVAGNFVLPETRRLTPGMVGHDFLAFYTAGAFLRDDRPHDLYDLDKVKAFQHDLARRENLEIGESFGPFWNPPFYAWVFAPLARLPYHDALLAWETERSLPLRGILPVNTNPPSRPQAHHRPHPPPPPHEHAP